MHGELLITPRGEGRIALDMSFIAGKRRAERRLKQPGRIAGFHAKLEFATWSRLRLCTHLSAGILALALTCAWRIAKHAAIGSWNRPRQGVRPDWVGPSCREFVGQNGPQSNLAESRVFRRKVGIRHPHVPAPPIVPKRLIPWAPFLRKGFEPMNALFAADIKRTTWDRSEMQSSCI